MICFPKEFKPVYISNNELIRVGSIDDGGYVVHFNAVKKTTKLISFGISDNWDFERNFIKVSSAKIYAYDYSIDNIFWKNKFKVDLIKFFQLKIFKLKKLYKMIQYLDFLYFFKFKKDNHFFLKKIGNDKDSIQFGDVIKYVYQHNDKLFLKVDIEGFEYEIINEIIYHKEKLVGIVIEFHKTTENLMKIINFIEKLKPNLQLIHIHANNYSVKKKNQFPEAIELSFTKTDFFAFDQSNFNKKRYPIKNLDFPNSKRSPDVDIFFK